MDNLKRKDEAEHARPYLHVEHSRVEMGQTYPIFGMITGIIEEGAGELIVELNNSINVLLHISYPSRVLAIKQKAFETGIFVSTVLETTPRLLVECKMVIFGKSQAHQA